MGPFEYIAVLLSIVISLALAHLLAGIAHMIDKGVRRFSIPLAAAVDPARVLRED